MKNSNREKITRRAALSACSVAALGTAGCFGSTPNSRDTSYRVGLLTRRLPEPFGDWDVESGASLAVRDTNRDGGVNGSEIELLVRDVADSPSEGTHYNRLQNDHDVDVTMGLPPRVGESNPLWPLENHETLHFTLGTWGPELADRVGAQYDTYKYHFRIGMPNSVELAAAFASFVEDHYESRGWKRCAIYIEQPDRRGVNETFGTTLAAQLPSGIEVRSTDEVRQSTDIGSYLTELHNDGVDVLFTAITGSYGKLVDQMTRSDIDIDVGGFHRASTHNSFWEFTEGNCRDVFSVSPMTPETEHTDRTGSFVAGYEEQYGERPEHPAATAYDALFVYKRAVEQTLEGQSGSGKPAQEQVVETLAEGSFTGETLYSKYEFRGPDYQYPHEPRWKSMASDGIPIIEQWQRRDGDGVRSVLAPSPHGDAALE